MLLTFISFDKLSHLLHSHLVMLCKKDCISVDWKGICIDCRNLYSCWDKCLHYQKYYLRMCPHNCQWVYLDGYLLSCVLHQKGKPNPLTIENSKVIYLLAYVSRNNSCCDSFCFLMNSVSSSIMILMHSLPDIYESSSTMDSQTFHSCSPATMGLFSALV